MKLQKPTKPIKFFREYKPHGHFSNFFAAPIDLEGKTWPTVEHFF